jgi:hypothetical protein
MLFPQSYMRGPQGRGPRLGPEARGPEDIEKLFLDNHLTMTHGVVQ